MGVSRATLYRRRKRPELRSRRPRKLCRPRWRAALAERSEALREDNPVWGKGKLGPPAPAEGHAVSDSTVEQHRRAAPSGSTVGQHRRAAPSGSTVGRIPARLVRRDCLPPVTVFRRPPGRTRRARRPYVRRLRGALPAKAPAKPCRSTPSRSPCCRAKPANTSPLWTATPAGAAGMAASQAASASAARFLHKLVPSAPFPIRAGQVDGGSEFHKHFENACQQHRIALYVLPPRSPQLNSPQLNSPQLNGRVERMQATWATSSTPSTPCPTAAGNSTPRSTPSPTATTTTAPRRP